MYATFVPVDHTGTIVEPAMGWVLTPKLPSGNRVILIVSEEDAAKVTRHLTGTIEVTDLMTGTIHRLKGASCGLGCRCAMAFA